MAKTTQVVPTKEQIETRAYELYVTRGREDGYATEDWYSAENELLNQSMEDPAITNEENREAIGTVYRDGESKTAVA